ncbi:MAG: hypothetical protein JST89_24275 [Cyanobacteria bacterium SZAS-4]|nr:hypothetical protein [Cyanobacteria bacterium SZAS-4]
MTGHNTPNTANPTDANDGRRPQSPETTQALLLFQEVKEAWSRQNRDNIRNFTPPFTPESANTDFVDFNTDDPYQSIMHTGGDNSTASDFSQYHDLEGNVFTRNPTDGSESVRHPGVYGELGSLIATRTSDGIISDMSGSWKVDEHHHVLSLIEEKTGIRYVIEESNGGFRIQRYNKDESLLDVLQMTPEQMENLLKNTKFQTTDNTYNPATDIASFTTNGETMYFDFHTGALGIGGFGPGHYVFNENGSMTMPNGDVVTKDGTIIKGSDFLLHLKSNHDPAAAEAIQAEAQNYMSNVLAKIASKSVTPEDFGALMNCYSALGSVGMFSAAASIMQGAVGSVMNEASNLMSRINTALGMNVTDSTSLATVADDIYTNAYVSAAQIQHHAFDVATQV